MINVKGLTKMYGERLALDNVSFEVKKGEILGFLGFNGAGKSTTMKMLSCFMPPTAGTAEVAGFDIIENPTEVKKRVGFLPEYPPLYFDMVVKEYLTYAAKLKGVPSKEVKSAVDMAITQCNLQDVAKRLVGNLSKGYKQRVALAQSLVNNPEVLILDEPTVGLDPKQIVEIRNLIKGLAGSRTVILSTHILPEVTAVCERIIIIHQGKLVTSDKLSDLSSKVQKSHFVDIIVNENPESLRDKFRSIDGISNVALDGKKLSVEYNKDLDLRAKLAATVVESGSGLLELTQRKMDLEDVFMHLTTKDLN